jgi:hypothetical protein
MSNFCMHRKLSVRIVVYFKVGHEVEFLRMKRKVEGPSREIAFVKYVLCVKEAYPLSLVAMTPKYSPWAPWSLQVPVIH